MSFDHKLTNPYTPDPLSHVGHLSAEKQPDNRHSGIYHKEDCHTQHVRKHLQMSHSQNHQKESIFQYISFWQFFG